MKESSIFLPWIIAVIIIYAFGAFYYFIKIKQRRDIQKKLKVADTLVEVFKRLRYRSDNSNSGRSESEYRYDDYYDSEICL